MAEDNFSRVVDAAAGGFERPDESPAEPVDPQTETMGASNLAAETADEAPVVVGEPGSAGKDKPKVTKAPAHIVGETPLGLPLHLQVAREEIRQKEINAAKATSFSILQEGKALAQTKADAMFLYEEDYEQMVDMNDTYLARWKQESQELRDDMDAARQLRVNPHNYMQSVGRSGRVSSVLSVAVSQLAAGAGNPNSAWQRIQTAVNRDIAAQKANIQLTFKGIDAAKGLQTHEADMLAKFYDFEDRARAVGMTAIAAQVGVIKQHAANEQEYISWQMIEDRADAAAIDAFAVASSKKATALIDFPIRTRSDVVRERKLREMLTQSFADEAGLGQPQGAVDTSVQLLGGETFGEAPTQGVPVTAAAPTAGPVATPPGPPSARVATDRRVKAPEAPVAAGGAVEAPPIAAVGMTAPEGAVEAVPVATQAAPVEAPPAVAAPTKAGPPQLTQEAYDKSIEGVPRETMAAGGFAHKGWKDEKRVIPPHSNTYQQGVKELFGPNPRIDVFPGYHDAVRGRLLDPRKNSAEKRYEQAHPELYVQPLSIQHTGTATNPRYIEQNFMDTAHGRIPLKYTSTLIDDEKARVEKTEAFNADFNRVTDMNRQAKRVREHGAGTFFGFVNFSTKNGISLTPFSGEESAEMATIRSQDIQLGIAAMKKLDPSGRLTDKDIDVGKAIMNALMGDPFTKVADVMESAWKWATGNDNYDQNAAREGVSRFMVALANQMQHQLVVEQYHDVVLPFQQHQKITETRRDNEKFLHAEKTEVVANDTMEVPRGQSVVQRRAGAAERARAARAEQE